MKIFFIGNPQLADGYRIAGLEVYPVSSDKELMEALETVASKGEAGIALIDSDFTSSVKDRVERLKLRSRLPVIVEVPGRRRGADVDLKAMISRIMGVKV